MPTNSVNDRSYMGENFRGFGGFSVKVFPNNFKNFIGLLPYTCTRRRHIDRSTGSFCTKLTEEANNKEVAFVLESSNYIRTSLGFTDV